MKLKVHAFAVVLLAGLLTSQAAQAMTFDAFGRMNDDDEATYVTGMVSGASDLLKAQGHPDQADKVIALFHDTSNDGGVHQFALNLKSLFNLNKRNATNPNNRANPYIVEDAMEMTLKDKGLVVTAAQLLAMNKDFRPAGLPRKHAPGT